MRNSREGENQQNSSLFGGSNENPLKNNSSFKNNIYQTSKKTPMEASFNSQEQKTAIDEKKTNFMSLYLLTFFEFL